MFSIENTCVDVEYNRFAVVDTCLNNLMRPAPYDAVHAFKPIFTYGETVARFDIVGPVCESAGMFVTQTPLASNLKAGVYELSMSSRYNMGCRLAEVDESS